MTLPALRDLIDQQFNDGELRRLCFDLDIEYENLSGDTHIDKAQSLVQYCMRHNRLPDLEAQCRHLRPNMAWTDTKAVATELVGVQQMVKTLTTMVNDETLLAAIRKKEIDLLTQLLGSGAAAFGKGTTAIGERGVMAKKAAVIATGDNNQIQNIVNIYRAGGRERISEEQLGRAIADYASWVIGTYGRVPLRGLSEKEVHIPDPTLRDIYVSLAAQQEARGSGRWAEEEQERKPIDMGGLLAQGQKLIITGAPGSGKTTFLRHIAYLLADAIHTGDKTAVSRHLNLHDAPPLPIYLSLGDYHRYKQDNSDGTLIDFISHTLIQQHGVYDLPKDFFAQLLSRKSSVCLLLDSLDEIPDENGRFQATLAIVQLAAHPNVGHIIVASRDHAYVGRVMLPSNFRRFIVQPMRPKQVAALAKRWITAVYPPHLATAETKKLQDAIIALEAIRQRQGEAALIDTPLMVTIVAIVHYNERTLPQQRAALYEKCVNALLAEQHKGEEGEGQSQTELEQRGGLSSDAKRGHLGQLAYEMMSSRSDKEAGRSASRTQIETWLLPLFRQTAGADNAAAQLEQFRRAMCDRASILHERSGVHEFTHLTFQEFLCAQHLALNETPAAIATFFLAQDRVHHSWWRETILLTIGYLGKIAASKSLQLVQEMLSPPQKKPTASSPPGGGLRRGKGLQGRNLAAAELATTGLLELEAPAPDVRQQAHERLVGLLTDPKLTIPATLRALAGRSLSKLGDRRRGVGTITQDGMRLPDILWGEEVPPGKYRIGGDKESKYGFDERQVPINHAFRLSQYLITNAQFQCFIDADDRDQPQWWQGMPEDKREFDDPYFPYANHPREQVSYYQAVAFCRWLSDKLGQEILLPHEVEWEVAARWSGKGTDGRFYPWGNEFDAEKANTEKGGVGQTTAVGIYPAGKNPTLNLYDLSGNVWEWCRNKYHNPDDEAIDDSNNRRVLRGGSWNLGQYFAPAICRFNDHPNNRNLNIGFRVLARRFPSQ